MRKYLATAAALAAVGMGSATAQQREATLYTIELPKAAFKIVLATAKPGAWNGDIRNFGYPGPHVAYLMGAELWHPINDELLNVLDNVQAWSIPTCSFHAKGEEPWQHSPVAVYLVPKQQPFPALTR
jgi:hypothetical protein